MKRHDDSGQIKFWQVAIVLVLVLVVAFDLLSPQLIKVQLKDKGDNIALQESQNFQRGGGGSFSARYGQACQNVQRAVTAYGAVLVPLTPDSVDSNGQPCPDISDDGRVKFRMQKKAPSILIGRFAMKNYYIVEVDIDEKYSF